MTEEDKPRPKRNYTKLDSKLTILKEKTNVDGFEMSHQQQVRYLLNWISKLSGISLAKLTVHFKELVGARLITSDPLGHVLYYYPKKQWKWVRAYKNLLKTHAPKRLEKVPVPKGNWYSCSTDRSWGFMKLFPGEKAGAGIIEILPSDVFCPWKWYPGRDASPEAKEKLFAARLAQKEIWAKQAAEKARAKAKMTRNAPIRRKAKKEPKDPLERYLPKDDKPEAKKKSVEKTKRKSEKVTRKTQPKES
jgi:hypothetical protein